MKSQTSHFESRLPILEYILQWIRFLHVRPYITRGATIADLGCGYNAYLLRKLQPNIKSGVGIDVAVLPKTLGSKIRLQVGRADRPLSLPALTFNVVTALAVIEHVEDPNMLLCEAFRILKPDGFLLLTVPAPIAKPFLELLAFRFGVLSASRVAEHKRYFSRNDLAAHLVEAGFHRSNCRIKQVSFGLNLVAVCQK